MRDARSSRDPSPLLEGLSVRAPFGAMDYSVAANGSLIYRRGAPLAAQAELVWVTRTGEAVPVDPGWTFDPSHSPRSWSLSPDGTRIVATQRGDTGIDLWVKQLPDGPFDRLTSDPGDEVLASWSPDGASILYSKGGADRGLWRRPADGTGSPELLMSTDRPYYHSQWSPDGTRVVFAYPPAGVTPLSDPGSIDISWFRPGVDRDAVRLVGTPTFIETLPAISPDGLWLAYETNESGDPEIYVRPFPDVDAGRVRISTAGGQSPAWSRSGSELFYLDEQQGIIAAEVDGRGGTFTVRARHTLFTPGPEFLVGVIAYDVSADDRFLMARRAGTGGPQPPTFVLVQNWFSELRRLSPN